MNALNASAGTPSLPTLHASTPTDETSAEIALVGFASDRTLGDGLARLARSPWLDTSEQRPNFVKFGQVAAFELRPRELDQPLGVSAVHTLLSILRLAQLATAETWQPIWVRLPVSLEELDPEAAALARRLPVRPELGPPAFAVRETDLELGMRNPDPDYLARLDARAPDVDRSGWSLRDRVWHVLGGMLGRGRPTVGRVARQLGVSPRTLQRHLEREGTSFVQVLDEFRHTVSRRYLEELGTPKQQVSDLLGFSDPRAFRRALRRWQTRRTPGGPQLTLVEGGVTPPQT